MNEYTFQELRVGHEESFSVTVTEKMLESFLDITGDVNPLHRDEDYAIRMGYNSRVVYGMLTSSFLSTLAGVYLPGKYSLIHEVKTKFVLPVYPGDVLEVKGTVSEMYDTFNMFEMKVSMVNQHGKKVLKGKMKVGVVGGGK